MRTIIAGSRHIRNDNHLLVALAQCPWTDEITSVVCGGAPGVDCLGDRWAKAMGLPVSYFLVARSGVIDFSLYANLVPPYQKEVLTYRNVIVPSDWHWDGDAAGPIRNRAMAAHADALLAIPLRGDRRGTDSMLRQAYQRGLRIFTREVQR